MSSVGFIFSSARLTELSTLLQHSLGLLRLSGEDSLSMLMSTLVAVPTGNSGSVSYMRVTVIKKDSGQLGRRHRYPRPS